ncbi:MAG: WD40 repeat domain-containing protein [Gemmataceae bacterium]
MTRLHFEQTAGETERHDGEVLTCKFLPDNSSVISGGWDGTLRIWDTIQGVCLDHFTVAQKPVSACAVSPQGDEWYVGTMDGLLSVWNAEARTQKTMFLAHTRPISSLVFSPDGLHLASVSWDRNVSLWTVNGKLEGQPIGSHADIVSGCQFTPSGRRMITWSYDGFANIWDVPTKSLVYQMQGHEDRITAGDISPDGQWFVSGTRNCEVKLWELQYGQEANSLPLQAQIAGCFFLRDAKTVVILDANGRLTLHDVPSMQILDELPTYVQVQGGCLSPSGGMIALAGDGGLIHIVSLEGYDAAPLAITATQSTQSSASLLQKLFGQASVKTVYHCVCPACRAHFDLSGIQAKGTSTKCPQCYRAIKICAVAETPEEAPAG